MTASDLQDALMDEVRVVLKDIITEDVTGRRVSGVNVFAQQLPVIMSDEESASQFFPYAVIKILDAATGNEAPWTVSMGIYLGVRDTDKKNQGHKHVMVMVQRIVDRFASAPLLENKYWAQPDMEWALDSENAYPHFFGGICIKFSVPKIGREMTEYD